MIRIPQRAKVYEEAWYACVDCDSSGDYKRFPESMTVEYRGKRYCTEHFRWRFSKALQDEADPPTFPDERG